jgi:hypothetical protein
MIILVITKKGININMNNTPVDIKLSPIIRIYLSAINESQDFVDLDVIEEFVMNNNNKTPSEVLKELFDQGIINVYVCSFDKVKKII